MITKPPVPGKSKPSPRNCRMRDQAAPRPLNHRRRVEVTQAPAWVTLAGIIALITAIYLSTK